MRCPRWWPTRIETCRQTCKVAYKNKIKGVHLLATKFTIITECLYLRLQFTDASLLRPVVQSVPEWTGPFTAIYIRMMITCCRWSFGFKVILISLRCMRWHKLLYFSIHSSRMNQKSLTKFLGICNTVFIYYAIKFIIHRSNHSDVKSCSYQGLQFLNFMNVIRSCT
jgi:hypothetical protein